MSDKLKRAPFGGHRGSLLSKDGMGSKLLTGMEGRLSKMVNDDLEGPKGEKDDG